jgi:hypothetical protein
MEDNTLVKSSFSATVADAATLLDGKLDVRTFRVITDLHGA